MRTKFKLYFLYYAVIFVWLWPGAGSASDTCKIVVTASTDDAKTYNNSLETGASDAVVGYTGDYRCDYLARFVEVPLPPGANIDSAFISLHCSSSQSGTTCNAVIYAEDTASAAGFSSGSDYAARLVTSAACAWPDIPAQSALTWYRTPDIKNIVQEIVDRGDWADSNALAVFIRDDSSDSGAMRRFYQYDRTGYVSLSACSLVVYFTDGVVDAGFNSRRRKLMTLSKGNL
ncbi:MAG: hypothetical protein ACOYVF_12885 [Candidatus Zixiibacteriota bacterium]